MATNEIIAPHLEPDTGFIYVAPSDREIGLYQKTIQFIEGKDGTGAAGTYTGTINVPYNSIIRDIEVRSSVVWAAGTTAAMDVGDSGDPDGYYSAINLLTATELLVDEVVNFNNLGGVDGAYITAAAGSFVQTYLNGADVTDGYDIIGLITTTGTAATAGRTIMTVYYNIPEITFDEVVYAAA